MGFPSSQNQCSFSFNSAPRKTSLAKEFLFKYCSSIACWWTDFTDIRPALGCIALQPETGGHRVQYIHLHPVPRTCKWLNHVLKLLVCSFMFCRVVLVPRSNILKICGQKFEKIRNNWKNTVLWGIFCTSMCPHPAIAD